MLNKVACTAVLFSLATCLALPACTPVGKSVAWKDQNASLADYKAFKIMPVFDATKKQVDRDILTRLTALLKERFEEKNLPLTDSPQVADDVLVVQTELMAFDLFIPAKPLRELWITGWGKSQCTLRSDLLAKSNSYLVARIVTTQEFGAVVDYLRPPPGKFHERVLEAAANKIAEEVARLMEAEGAR